ncbi:AAA domain-containing protein [Pseudomonas sp. B21-056]|jgi:RecA/RadA recombinase|uniref:AAA domain-containing protein n=1 Tax=Pseudomonas sp. B21-056 TaxID=2895495 RepID=UPI002232AF0E|nr:AAA domain-containing protein [Pseudomonas sp. B21-056]UZE26430.1 AAA domain-containing protein [Pseudomonas sp. B21-056]
MVSIRVRGEDKTRQISDWSIKGDRSDALLLVCHFPSGKRFSSPLEECEVAPTRVLSNKLLRTKGSAVLHPIEKAAIYGEKYAVVQYSGSTKNYVFKLSAIEFVAPTRIKDEPLFHYFLSVAHGRVDQAAKPADKVIAENVLRQLNAIPSCSDTALHAYCSRQNGQQAQAGDFIFPFGINESQLQAVERAFTSQISLIEGPPGTGKTQTILNIIANILLRGKTVAVVSNNNSAVANVCEKLGKSGLDYLVAELGSTENREAFFANPRPRPSALPEATPSMERIQVVLQQLKGYLSTRNAVAQLQIEINELEVERRYLQQWQQDNGVQIPPLDKFKLTPQKSADMMAYLAHLGGRRVRIKDRIELLFNFRILRTRPFDNWEKRQSMFYGLQLHYYDKALQEKNVLLKTHQQSLRLGNYQALLDELTSISMKYLKQHLHRQVSTPEPFEAKTYKRKFDEFVKRYPIISSSTHSIINSLPAGAMLDYVIIDEASQQDIVPGVLALGCAKQLIIVGDRKQLAHIPAKLGLAAPQDKEHYDCETYSLLDSCVRVFNGSIPTTLLKEHYRCHPRIIQFCNQQFYDDQLVPMTRDNGENPLSLLVTAKGNHTRKTTNLRELDSLLATLEGGGESAWEGEDGRGFIAPFRAQAALSSTLLPADFVNDTVHKFQGRECDEIVFSTVLDKKSTTPKFLTFVDDPRMVNVAVSRAKNRFTLVTGDDVFTANNGHIAALVRYIEYYAEERQVHRAPVISAFDLLYAEYDQSLERLNQRLRREDSDFKSERIIAQILRETLEREVCRGLMFHSQVPLKQVASTTNASLTPRELEFMGNGSSCDFVLYFKVGKTPLGVLEVDGASHDTPEQARLDALKDSILDKCGIPLLRLRTVESRIEQRVAAFVMQWATSASTDSVG